METFSKQRDTDEQNVSALERKIDQLEHQLIETQESLQSETAQKLSLQTKIRNLENDLVNLTEQQEEQQHMRNSVDKEVISLKQQLSEARKKINDDISQQYEELKKKHLKEVENLQKQITESESSKERSERAKKKFQEEVEDLNIELNSVRTTSREFEKKQRRFEQQVAEAQASLQKCMLERDAHAQESRDRETKILSLNNELEEIRERFAETERIKRELQLDLDELVGLFILFFF